MKKYVFMVSMALLCGTVMVFADGATDIQYSLGKPRLDSDVIPGSSPTAYTYKLKRDGAGNIEYDTFGKCDEQYFSAIQLTIARYEAHPFSVDLNKFVEFSKGNLQYSAGTNTFRFAEHQYDIVGDGTQTTYPVVYWDSLYHKMNGTTWAWIKAVDGVTDSCYDFDTAQVPSCNQFVGKNYGGWIDLFGWGTSGLDAMKVFGVADPQNHAIYPFSINNVNYDGTTHAENPTGYGPSKDVNIDNTTGIVGLQGTKCQYYDWGRYNDIYCKWYGSDTITKGGVLTDTTICDSTIFHATEYSVVTGKQDSFVNLWRTLTLAEWAYVFNSRNVNNQGQNWALGEITIDGAGTKVKGVLLFPDDYSEDAARGVVLTTKLQTPLTYKGTSFQTISLNDWTALEYVGVVFLPFAGQRNYRTFTGYGTDGYYWAVTSQAEDKADAVHLTTAAPDATQSIDRFLGCSVRLVHDVEEDAGGHTNSIFFRQTHDLSQHNSIYKHRHP